MTKKVIINELVLRIKTDSNPKLESSCLDSLISWSPIHNISHTYPWYMFSCFNYHHRSVRCIKVVMQISFSSLCYLLDRFFSQLWYTKIMPPSLRRYTINSMHMSVNEEYSLSIYYDTVANVNEWIWLLRGSSQRIPNVEPFHPFWGRRKSPKVNTEPLSLHTIT